ncbi:phosphotransferase [Streptomyces sp. NEAU-YJ-81]|uniref:phosphotransferase n=1 Tax=Streptomyces sp. NEAU-YJ-81 TaxID=2820288 RepID=UPI0027DF145F|nr:phosphotransferase [Streptomyces sp. NEAU-YJ-81]
MNTSTSAAPDLEDVFTFADAEIRQAATELWPHAVIEAGVHVPSVTTYVRRLKVDGAERYAKYSVLGVSLVSLLRGSCGGWDQIRRDQAAYVRRQDSLTKREAAQLRFLATLGRPKACRAVGSSRGVLFTEAVPGLSLAELLLQRPQEAAELLAAPLRELYRLHLPAAQYGPGTPAPIRERSIAVTFRRKFHGPSGQALLDQLGEQRCALEERGRRVELLRQTVARLSRFRSPTPRSNQVVTFGDLKPEHVYFPGPGGQPVFIDPGLQPGRACVDTAKLVSRTALLLVAARPGDKAGRQITSGIDAVLHAQLAHRSSRAREASLRELLVLWLMDTVNIVTSYLSAPAALPLPAQAEAVVQRAAVVCIILDRLTDGLAHGLEADAVWEQGLALIRAAAS